MVAAVAQQGRTRIAVGIETPLHAERLYLGAIGHVGAQWVDDVAGGGNLCVPEAYGAIDVGGELGVCRRAELERETDCNQS